MLKKSTEEIKNDLLGMLAISNNLDAEFANQCILYANVSFNAAVAHDEVRKTEEMLEVSFYELYDEYKKSHKDAKENECKSFVRTDLGYRELTDMCFRLQHIDDLMKVAVKAFEMREKMLIQLGAQSRKEYGMTDMKILTNEASEIVKKQIKQRRNNGDL